MGLDHAKLDVYQCALDLLEQLDDLVSGLPAGRAHLKDQLDRAATSIVLNIAEGAGEFLFDRRGHARAERLEPIRELLIRVVSMLTKLSAR